MMQYTVEHCKEGADEYTGILHTTPNTVEIIQPLSSGGTVQIEKTVYPMVNGDLYIINMDNMHCTAPDPVRGYRRNKIFINSRFLYSLLKTANDENGLDEFFFKSGGSHIALSPEAASYFDTLCRQFSHGQDKSPLHQLSVLIQILDFCTATDQPMASIQNRYIQNAMDYIASHFAFSICVDAIADAIFVSKYYLCRAFKKSTGMTIMEYVNEHRLQAAKKKLLYGSGKISEIADSCGYSSFSLFSKQFKRATGYSPSEYRNFFSSFHESPSDRSPNAVCRK